MNLPRQHRHRVEHNGESFVVCTQRTGWVVRVVIERAVPPDERWVVLADGRIPVPEGADRRNEFAVSCDDLTPLAEEIAFTTGLFQRTGRTADSARRACPIWSLTSASPLRIRDPGEPDMRPLHDPQGLHGKEIPALMDYFAAAVREHDVTGIVVTGPDMAGADPDQRTVVGGMPEKLRALSPQHFASDRRRMHPATEWGELASAPYIGASAFAMLGFEAWISVRTALTDGHYYEVMMLGPASLTQATRPHLSVPIALNMVSPLRRATVAALGLTPRELEVLRNGAMGVKETGQILGLTTSTIKFHRDNIRRKVGGERWEHAFVNAQTLGVFE